MPNVQATRERAFRPSSYTIVVETHDEDECILLHGYTKAVDLVPAFVARRLEQRELAVVPDDVGGEEAYHTLIRRGYLTNLDAQQERVGFVKLIERIDALRRRTTRPGFVLMPTYLCNLDCFYCYQKPAIESDAELVKHLMSQELADKAFAAYASLLPDGQGLQGADVLLYGGEPLLRSSRKLIEYVVRKAHSHGMSVRAISNGTQLEHYEDLLGPAGIHWLQITLDGPREVHDTRRVTRGGKGSFDAIVANIDRALARGAKISIRLNIDRFNLDALDRLDTVFRERGWYQHPNVQIYAAEVHMVEDQEQWMDHQALVQPMDISASIRERGLSIQTSRHNALDAFQAVNGAHSFDGFKTGYCGANYGMTIFDSKGNVYSCWDEVEMFEPVGEYTTGQLRFNERLRRAWNRSPLAANPRCHECAYAFYCGGGCDWHGKKEGDAYYDRYCPDFMHGFRSAIAEDYAITRIACARGAGDGAILTEQARAELLREVSDKLSKRNLSACSFSCSSQVIKDEAEIHQKKTGLIQLLSKGEALSGARREEASCGARG